MNQRQRKRKLNRINSADLAPLVAEGYTEGASAEEAFQEADSKRPITKPNAAVGHMKDVDTKLEQNRGGFAGFVATDDPGAVWTDGATDRIQYDLHKTYTKGGMALLKMGRQCLRCDEPLDPAFPVVCPLCGYAVHDRQIMDIAMEFEGERHLGPSAPITEYMEQQNERVEKRQFIQRVLDGGQGKVPKEWFKDKELMEGLSPQQRFAIGARDA